YVTSLSGIQVLDQLGRVNAIIPVPRTKGQVSNLCFGGPEFDVLYITCHDQVFRRKVKVKGANNFEKPIKPGTPRLLRKRSENPKLLLYLLLLQDSRVKPLP